MYGSLHWHILVCSQYIHLSNDLHCTLYIPALDILHLTQQMQYFINLANSKKGITSLFYDKTQCLMKHINFMLILMGKKYHILKTDHSRMGSMKLLIRQQTHHS